jgi:hypothetical protein
MVSSASMWMEKQAAEDEAAAGGLLQVLLGVVRSRQGRA